MHTYSIENSTPFIAQWFSVFLMFLDWCIAYNGDIIVIAYVILLNIKYLRLFYLIGQLEKDAFSRNVLFYGQTNNPPSQVYNWVKKPIWISTSQKYPLLAIRKNNTVKQLKKTKYTNEEILRQNNFQFSTYPYL